MKYHQNIPIECIQLLSAQQAWHYQVVPFQNGNNTINLYSNKTDIDLKDELELLLGLEVEFQALPEVELQQLLGQYYRRNREGAFAKSAKEGDFLENLIREARFLDSSDIHIEPYEERARVRFRVDGVLMEKYQLELNEYPGLVNKIKIKAQLDIAEKRLPQDGRIFFKDTSGIQFDIRVSSLPTLHGEKIVMRLLSNTDTQVDIRKLGFREEELEHYFEGAKQHNGIVLISGPTGSGKTTTLYSTLQILNETSRNIMTIEDPIEYTLEGINQVQLKERIGLNYASAIRTFLRQDPDVIMVGEIRDLETATMAIRASLTGHLVFSTIHTNSAWGIIARLLDMGVPSYLLADTLNTAVAQRLLRCLCSNCKVQTEVEPGDWPRQFKPPYSLNHHFKAKGCPQCHYSGYKGRVAAYEVISIDQELSEKIKNKEVQIGNLLNNKGIRSLSENAFWLISQGVTSISEAAPLLLNRER
jgi:general secretion pathway protein E/type IV pilus assembly protein PilB